MFKIVLIRERDWEVLNNKVKNCFRMVRCYVEQEGAKSMLVNY